MVLVIIIAKKNLNIFGSNFLHIQNIFLDCKKDISISKYNLQHNTRYNINMNNNSHTLVITDDHWLLVREEKGGLGLSE